MGKVSRLLVVSKMMKEQKKRKSGLKVHQGTYLSLKSVNGCPVAVFSTRIRNWISVLQVMAPTVVGLS